MKVEYDGIIFTDNIKKYVFEKNPDQVEVIKHYPVRNITVLKIKYNDGAEEIVSNIKACCSTKIELYGLMNYLSMTGFHTTTDPFSLGESLNKHGNFPKTAYKPYKEIHYKTEARAYYNNPEVFEWFKENLPWLHNVEGVKIRDRITSIDINSFGASLLMRIINNKQVKKTLLKLHELKLINEDDSVLRKFFKYTLIGYVNSFLFTPKFNLTPIKKVENEITKQYLEDEMYNNFLIFNNTLHIIEEQRTYTTLAPHYYEEYTNVWHNLIQKLNPLMVFGDNFYVKDSNIPNNLPFGNNIGEFKKYGELELISGSSVPGIIYFVSQSEHMIEGCLKGKIYGKVGGKYYTIWTYLLGTGLC